MKKSNIKRATLGLLAIFSVFLFILITRHVLLNGDVGLRNPKKVPVGMTNQAPLKELVSVVIPDTTVKTVLSSGVKYIPLEPNNLNTLDITKPTFEGNGKGLDWPSIFYSICFILLCGFAMTDYYEVALRVEKMEYLRALREERKARKVDKK